MTLGIIRHEEDGVVLLSLKGNLGRWNQGDLLATLRGLRLDGTVRVGLDLRELAYIDRAGVGALVLQRSRFLEAGGDLVLLNVNAYHVSVLSLHNLNTVFEIFDHQRDAVARLLADRSAGRSAARYTNA